MTDTLTPGDKADKPKAENKAAKGKIDRFVWKAGDLKLVPSEAAQGGKPKS
jgi:hypothetical protein